MFDNEYENPMVLGEYENDSNQSHSVRCKRCGRVWTGYEYEEEIEWECVDDSYISWSGMPTSKYGCRVCAWKKRTNGQLRAYVADNDLNVEILEYMLCNKRNAISRTNDAEQFWNLLFTTKDATIKPWVDELINDYIHERDMSGFVDWIMEGGYEYSNHGCETE